MTEDPKKGTRGPSEILIYQSEDGKSRIQVRLEDNTVWLTQALTAELFQTSVPNISMHIKSIFAEGELDSEAVVKNYLTTAAEVLPWKEERRPVESRFGRHMTGSAGDLKRL